MDDSSTVVVDGKITTRTYADGAVQQNIWPTEQAAQDYADSVKNPQGTAAKSAALAFLADAAAQAPNLADAFQGIADKLNSGEA